MTRTALRPWILAVSLLTAGGFAFGQEEETPRPKPKPSKVARTKTKKPRYSGPVLDLLTASKAEIANLPGLNEDLADRIIAARPYKSKADLVTRNVLVIGQYLIIKDRVALGKPVPKK